MNDRPDKEQQSRLNKAELVRIRRAHEEWLNSDGREGQRADQEHATCIDAYLPGADLRVASIRFSNFRTADLTGAKLASSDFTGSDFGGSDLSNAVLHGAHLDNTRFTNADLIGADLRQTELKGAFLQSANLGKADLREANLHGAKLQGAKLQDANFTGANLQYAGFDEALDTNGGVLHPPADVKGAKFRGADLSDASLAHVSGLQAAQLAGTNLSSASLPEDIKQFEALDHVAEISKHARTIFLGVVGACVYSWLSIATTTDVALITGSTATPLPIIQTPVSIAGFYWAAPPILFVLYIYLHLYLQRMWEGMAELPAVFPDGRTLDQKVYPWLLSGLVASNVTLLKKRRPPSSWLQVGLSVIAAWGLVPFTLFLFWGRYLVRHDWPWTVWHLVLFLAASAYGFAAYRLARTTLRGEDPEKQEILGSRDFPTAQHLPGSLRHAQHRWVVAAAVLTVILSLGAIEGRPGGAQDDWRAWIPSPTTLFGLRTAADLTEVDVSIKPATWTGLSERPLGTRRDPDEQAEKARTELAQVKGAQLGGVDLRNAQARGAFLARADLRHADLRGANLRGAKLQEAKLSEADLSGASLAGANLLRADLVRTNLVDARLPSAVLQEADLRGAGLHRANLSLANLKHAELPQALLRGADLSHAILQYTLFTNADLRGADLKLADLSGANLTKTDLRGANLVRTDFSGAILSGAKVTQEQLNSACGDNRTQLDEGLTIPNC